MNGEPQVFLPGNTAVISGAIKGDLEPLARAIRQGLAVAHPSSAAVTPPLATSAAAPPSAEDPYEQLAKLAKLRDAGVVTEDEFAAKKQELLERM